MCLSCLLYTQSETGRFLVCSTTEPKFQYWLTGTNPSENDLWVSGEQTEATPKLRLNHHDFLKRFESLGESPESQLFTEKVK